MQWDIFGRVIDNLGDVGLCWRLAADLAGRGERVRLWLDDAAALRWMAPDGAAGVEVMAWDGAAAQTDPGDIVIEAFGCDPPAAFVGRMQQRRPVWINLEYLSAETYVERSHALRSPQPGGIDKWFFYPGFTPRTGGLLREPGLMARRAAFDRDAWLASRGWARNPGERVVTLFSYANPGLPMLLQRLADAPTLLLVAAGAAASQLASIPLPPALRTIALPRLPQPEFDQLLWSADLNFVRGEDSFVRAQWAGAPFVWQIYPQHDGAHAAKLTAFIDRFNAATGHDPGPLWRAWNGLGPWPNALPERNAWRTACTTWRDALLAQADLSTQLIAFAARKG